MKIGDIPYDMKFIFGPNLREVPVSKIQMLNGIVYIMEQLKSNRFTDAERAKWNGILGNYLRIVGELVESEKHLKASLDMFNKLDDPQGVFTNKLRLAHTYQWWTNFEMSNEMFAELLELAETDSDYSHFLDFIYQHCGKNQFDQKNYHEALDLFDKSLELRLEKDDKELISITKADIEACQYRLDNPEKFAE